MKKRIFFKCFVIILLSALVVFFSGVGITYVGARGLINERLETETKLTCALLDGEDDFSALEIFKNNDECRITVISLSGEVLYDSDTSEELENHVDREEVAAALAGEPRSVERYSETFGCSMTYYAMKTELQGGEQAVVRLALKSAQINSYILSLLPFLLVALLVSALIALLFADRLSRGVAEKMTKITKSLKSVNEGKYIPLDAEGEAEIAEIYSEINGLNERTHESLVAQRELARQKEEFFANASHELKTPMTAMLGLSELILAREDVDATTKRQTERIHKESLRMSELISDMLKLSRLEGASHEKIATCAVDVRAVAEDVLSELSQSIDEKNIHASIEGELTVLADEKRIYELLQNLCSNGVNYNKEGGILRVVLEQKGEGEGRICVRDSGIGIAEENIPHLCERFYRVDKSRSKKTGGTGLGLAIVKHVCALFSADLEIKSKLGVGTEITVTFKLDRHS